MSEKKRFLLRMDQKVYDALEKWASDELRSVNAQIELLLKKSLKDAGRTKEKD
ncbi:MAG: Arc family DNA-binding protein [Bacillus sp. (in: firmicutes)]